jgi:hypothetical protein
MQVHVGAKLSRFLHGAFFCFLQHNYFDLWPIEVGVMVTVRGAYEMLPCVFSFRGEKLFFVLPTIEVGRSGSAN